MAWLPITNIIQQQKRFLVNFIFIDFLGNKLALMNPQVYIYIYI